MTRDWQCLVLALTALVVGCGPTIRYVYNKPGIAPDQRSRDEAECKEFATVVEPLEYGYGWMSRWFDRDRFNECMANRGYVVRELRQE